MAYHRRLDRDVITLAELEALERRYRDGVTLSNRDMLLLLHMAKYGIRLDPNAACAGDLRRPPPKCPRCGAKEDDRCRG